MLARPASSRSARSLPGARSASFHGVPQSGPRRRPDGHAARRAKGNDGGIGAPPLYADRTRHGEPGQSAGDQLDGSRAERERNLRRSRRPSTNCRFRPSAALLGTASPGEALTPETKPPATRAPTPDISEQLAHITRSWRERLEPPAQTTGPTSRRRDIVTQEQFAHTIGYTVGWYRKLELGEQAGYSDDFLESVAAGFRLKDAEKTLLFLLAAGRAARPAQQRPALRCAARRNGGRCHRHLAAHP